MNRIVNHRGESLEVTDDEIKAYHPKCGTCKYKVKRNFMATLYPYYKCTNAKGIADILDLNLDYCSQHKSEENI